MEILHEDLKEPGAACCDLGIAAVICFHRGDTARRAATSPPPSPYAERIGNRVIGPLALARSLDCEHAGALPEALAALTAGFAEQHRGTRGDRGPARRRRPARHRDR